ncbi:nuclear transport factor 2 family protein [Aquimarina sp. 2201CG14-23]|uniref:nuclear transport factor 2 family protein n=1 Tax=Aquimarina mycalae TaxID=3040073 RepID=UPI002477D9C7|nr:nuclear transport factor 2 family protein [Aquimarina sp. 2201CG14-23]MDH7447250.1 nuclear transport factor 2 family protein [Aquimarina sp. 2201CG14-23]
MKKYLMLASFLIASIVFIGWIKTNDTKELKSEKIVKPSIDRQSKETMEIAMAYMEAMGKGDMETIKKLMHEDMIWQNSGDKSLPWIGPWKGKKAILEQFMPLFGENFKTVKWNTEDAFASGDTAAFFGTMVGLLTKSNQKTKEFPWSLRVKVKDGKIILWNWFEDSFEVSQNYHK